MKLLLCFIFIFALLITCSNAVIFSEIMYNPIGSDENAEWIEIFNDKNETINLDDWKFFEENTNHNLALAYGDYNLVPNEYAVIAEDAAAFLANYPNFTGTLFDSTFSLSNTGETIALKNKTGQVKDNFTYSYILGGDENGFSIGIYNKEWKETLPTPGKTNKVSDICDWSVSIYPEKLIFENKTDVSWNVKTERLLGEPSVLVLIKRSVEDIYGKTIKNYTDLWHNISTTQSLGYEPNLNSGTYMLKAEIVPECNDSNLENNFANELVAVKIEEKQTEDAQDDESDSSVEIVKLYDVGSDNKAKFGQTIRIRLNAYRGNNSKQVVSLWLENSERISKIFELKVIEKYSSSEAVVPLQIPSNCNGKLKDGSYTIVAEGLGEKDEMSIEIKDNLDGVCPKNIETKAEKTVSTEKTTTEIEQTKETTDFSEQIKKSGFNAAKPFAISTIIFESSQRKAEKLVPYALSFTVVSLAIFLLISRSSGL